MKAVTIYFHKSEPVTIHQPQDATDIGVDIHSGGVLVVWKQPTVEGDEWAEIQKIDGYNQGIWKSFHVFTPAAEGTA